MTIKSLVCALGAWPRRRNECFFRRSTIALQGDLRCETSMRVHAGACTRMRARIHAERTRACAHTTRMYAHAWVFYTSDALIYFAYDPLNIRDQHAKGFRAIDGEGRSSAHVFCDFKRLWHMPTFACKLMPTFGFNIVPVSGFERTRCKRHETSKPVWKVAFR